MSWPSRSRAIISRTDSMCRHSVGARSTPALFVGHQACPTGAKQRTVVKRGAGWAQLKKIVVLSGDCGNNWRPGLLAPRYMLEKSNDQTRDLSRPRGKCTLDVRRFRRAAFPRRIGGAGEQRSKRSHGLQRKRPLLARTQRTPRHHPWARRFLWLRAA